MKKSVLRSLLVPGVIVLAQLISSCSGETEQPKEENHNNMMGDSMKDHDKMGMGSKQTDSADITYVCPMHPEEKGKKGDKCPKCGMNMEPMNEHNHNHDDDDDDHDHDK